jgi:hypothetical protein
MRVYYLKSAVFAQLPEKYKKVPENWNYLGVANYRFGIIYGRHNRKVFNKSEMRVFVV